MNWFHSKCVRVTLLDLSGITSGLVGILEVIKSSMNVVFIFLGCVSLGISIYEKTFAKYYERKKSKQKKRDKTNNI